MGGGWVEIKAKRSWKDSNLLAGAGAVIREGLTTEEIEQANKEGRGHELMEVDPHRRIELRISLSVKGHSPGLIPDGMTVKQWLSSDEMDEDLGDFLLEEIDTYYESRKRTAEERKT